MKHKTIAVDWDGTLVEYNGYKGAGVFGPPIPAMVSRIKVWLAEGREVLIFTSRVSVEHDPNRMLVECKAIDAALRRMGLPLLQITANKYIRISEFWDDRAVNVLKNTGRLGNERYTGRISDENLGTIRGA